MNAVVLMKPIHDPKVALTEEEVNGADFGVKERHMVFGPYDENALETALYAKERFGLKVSVVITGEDISEELLRGVLAAGADEVLLIPKSSWHWAAHEMARVLKAALDEVDEVAMVLAGIQSGDWDTGIVPPVLAALWEAPFVGNLVSVEREDAGWLLTSRDGGRTRQYRTSSPFVASVTSSGHNTLRYPTMRDRLQAKRKPIRKINSVQFPPGRTIRLSWVPTEARTIEWISGDSDAEKGKELVKRLADRGWITRKGAKS